MLRAFIAATVVRPVTTTMLTIAIVLFGVVAAMRLPVELLPDLSYPSVTVQTEYPDAAPVEVEELITRPVEELVGAVPGIVRVESASREGHSEVVLDFAWGTGMDSAMADVREKLDRVVLPTAAERPIVLRYDPAQEPIMRLALTITDPRSAIDLSTLRDHADRRVKRQLEKLPGVAAVQIHGGEEEEVLVELDPARLAALGIGSQDVLDAISRDNVNRPGGALTEKESRYLVRTVHEARTPEALGEVIVRSQAGADLHLREVANVRRAPIEREELSLVDGREAVELAVYREGDANTVAVADGVLAELTRLPLDPGQKVAVLSSQATFIRSAIDEVKWNTVIGGALAVMVLLFFLRDLRSTLVIAAAIPISVLATFVPLRALDVSLNLMSLGGLALGVGMLVDNSIVVLEAIARRRDQAAERTDVNLRETAVEGTAEVASAVVASTLTTVAVFFPMAFVEGVAGQLVRDLAYAVSFSIVSSMIVSLTLVPVLQAIGQRQDAERSTDAPRSLIAWLAVVPAALWWPIARITPRIGRLLSLAASPLTVAYDRLEAHYPRLLRAALRHRAFVVLGALGICVASVGLVGGTGRALLPPIHQGEFFVQLTLPQGTALQRTTEVARGVMHSVADAEDVALSFARVGSVTQGDNASGAIAGTHLAQVNVRLTEGTTEIQEGVEKQLLERMRAAILGPDVTLRLGRPALFSFDPPIEIQVFSEEPMQTVSHATRILPDLRDVAGLVDVTPDDLSGRPEVLVRFDRERLGRLGLGVDQAASAVARAVQGEVATQMHAVDRQLDVRVQLPRVDRTRVEDVARIQVGVVDGVPVRLSAASDVESARGPAEIRRIDGRRGVRIRARLEGADLGGVAQEVETILDEHEDESGLVQTHVSGQAEEMERSLTSLVFTAALSIFLVYVVMASSFESLHHPFLIMFTVPLALAGVFLACFASRIPISAMVGIGFIILGGIVVNNAIVFINAVNHARGRGASVTEALVAAGRLRLRPILMTTLTTILGLTPMALGMGDGAALRQPLAISVIGGLSVATLLTLVVIPSGYSLIPGRRRDAWG
jgi:HAE1 family hydrophobic/amphiphilic exporter-1